MLDPGQSTRESHHRVAGVNDLPPTIPGANSIQPPSAATTSGPGHLVDDTHDAFAGAGIEYAWLTLLGKSFEETQQLRLATLARRNSLRLNFKAEGTVFDVRLTAQLAQLESAERKAEAALEAAMRDHPLGGFPDGRRGIGAPGIGRLLGLVGDPLARSTVSQFWQYCGHGDPLRSKRLSGDALPRIDGKPVQPFSPAAKALVWKIAQSAVQQPNGFYRPLFVKTLAAAEHKTHSGTCRNSVRPRAGKPVGSNGCGTSAHPEWGEPGSPWRPAHRRAHALRVVGKEILLDLWKYAMEVAAS